MGNALCPGNGLTENVVLHVTGTKGGSTMVNVKDFGAVGDGSANDTAAIQRAIDSGGIVRIPRGVYVTGTLYLKSNGGLHLEAGAVLRASHSRADYNADDFCPQNAVFSAESVTGAHLIVAVEQENISLSGEGCIDGDALYWMTEKWGWHLKSNPERPGQMIFFAECRGVQIRDLSLKNASYWHLFLHGCEEVIVSGVRISGHPLVINNDGIDIDCCRNVVVSGCLIDTADDALTLRAGAARLRRPKACENIVIGNCILRSGFANAIRVGVGSGEIRNACFSNIMIREGTRTGICFVSMYNPKKSGVRCISDLQFDNIRTDAYRPFNIKLLNSEEMPPPAGVITQRNIAFSNIFGTASATSYLIGCENGILENIRFKNVEFRYSGPGEAPHVDANGKWGRSSKDCAFFVKHAQHVTFDDVRIRWEGDDSGWKHELEYVDSKNVSVRNCVFEKGICES